MINKKKLEKTKALVLLSGGLDSMLAAKVLMAQGIEVTGLTFVSNFFGATQARVSAKSIGVELIEYDFKTDHLKMVKSPKHGYGKNMNPCIDCHGLMVKKAYKLMKEKGFDFIATGEVLGQRPKSQNKMALDLVEKYGKLSGYVLRPLSAKLLPETKMEVSSLVDREKLLSIQGRNREEQMKLARKYGIKEYPAPGGGCILTYSEYSAKLAEMFQKWPECNNDDIDLLRAGRVFWFNDVLVIIGRHKEDNDNIEKIAKKDDVLLRLVDDTGPIALVRTKEKTLKIPENIEILAPKTLNTKIKGNKLESVLNKTAEMVGYHTPRLRGKKIKINLTIINN